MPLVRWKYLETSELPVIDSILLEWRERQPETGVLALVCDRERQVITALQRAAAAVAVPLIGAIVPGLIVEEQFRHEGVLLVGFDVAAPHRILAMDREGNRTTDSALEALADFVTTHADEGGGDTLLLFVDVMIPDIASLLDRLYLEVGDLVNYAGTCVGSETFQALPCVFDGKTFAQDAILGLLLRQHPGVALAHHYRGGEALWVATATAGSQIEAIEGRPAFDVYQELMAREYGIDLDRESFYHYAVHFPFALSRAQDESLVRIPVAVKEDGTVCCSGEIPENALLSVVRAVEPGRLDAAREAGAGARVSGAVGVMAFYCAGRWLHLGQEAAHLELTALVEELKPMPLFGMLSLGEIGSKQRQYPAFHNATILTLPWI